MKRIGTILAALALICVSLYIGGMAAKHLDFLEGVEGEQGLVDAPGMEPPPPVLPTILGCIIFSFAVVACVGISALIKMESEENHGERK